MLGSMVFQLHLSEHLNGFPLPPTEHYINQVTITFDVWKSLNWQFHKISWMH